MAWKFGLWFGILVVMFSCISDNNNLAKALCPKTEQLIVLVNDTYTGVIGYFNISQNTTVEIYIIATANYSMVTNASSGVTGFYLNESLTNCNIYPVHIDVQYVNNISCGSNFTWNHFPSCSLRSNYTCADLSLIHLPIRQFSELVGYAIMPPTGESLEAENDVALDYSAGNLYSILKHIKDCSSQISPTTTECTSISSFTASTGMEISASTTSTLENPTSPVSTPEYPKKKITLSPVSVADKFVRAEDIVNRMNNLSSVLDQMGNDTIAAVLMGVVKGIIEVIPNKTTPEDVTYMSDKNSTFAKLYNGTRVNFMTLFKIPGEAIDIARKHNNKSFIAIFHSPPMIEDENKQNILNPGIFSIEMGTTISNLSHMIDITYTNITKGNGNLTCCSWNGTGQPSWKTDGCSTAEINNTLICRCTHLTFFAVLMSPAESISSSDVKKLTYITYIGCGVSTFFLGIALFMHVTLRSKSTKTTKIFMNLFVSMFMLNLTFLLNDSITSLKNDPACKFIAGTIHYFLLSTFTWFAIEAFHLYLQFIKVFNINIRYYMVKILVVGWACPLLVPVVIAAVGKYGLLTINTTDNVPLYTCWITDSSVSYIVNIGYYVAVFIFTSVVFIMVAYRIVYLRKANVGQPKRRSVSKDMFTVAGLCGLLGITWGFAFFNKGPLLIPSYYIFTILNSFQGFFLFLYDCMTNKDAGDSRKSTLRSTISNIKSTDISHSTDSKSQ